DVNEQHNGCRDQLQDHEFRDLKAEDLWKRYLLFWHQRSKEFPVLSSMHDVFKGAGVGCPGALGHFVRHESQEQCQGRKRRDCQHHKTNRRNGTHDEIPMFSSGGCLQGVPKFTVAEFSRSPPFPRSRRKRSGVRGRLAQRSTPPPAAPSPESVSPG